jgi:hypothetical protein
MEQMCARAVEAVLRRLSGAPVEQRIVVPSELVVKESCGCRGSRLVAQTGVADAALPRISSAPGGVSLPTSILASGLSESLASNSPHAFLDALDIEIRNGFALGRGTVYWQHRLTLIAEARAALLTTDREQLALERMIGMGRIFLSDLMERRALRKEARNSEILTESYLFAENLAWADDFAKVADVVANARQQMSITSSHLIVLDEKGETPDSGRLLIKDNLAVAESKGHSDSITGYLAQMLAASPEPRALICNMLKCWQDPVGGFVCEADIPDLQVLLKLRSQVATRSRWSGSSIRCGIRPATSPPQTSSLSPCAQRNRST